MEKLLRKLRADYPNLTFVEGSLLCWSPEKQEIYYDPSGGLSSLYGVLHEIGHARLGHASYDSDIDLLKKEAEAWQEALRLAPLYGLELNSSHVQDCIDTYREWLYRRSTCPLCGAKGVQSGRTYTCINCTNQWIVSSARFLRPYRRKQKARNL